MKRGPLLPLACLVFEVDTVTASFVWIATEDGLLAGESGIGVVLLEREHLVHPHGIDEFSVANVLGRSHAQHPVATVCVTANLWLAVRQRAEAPVGVWGKARVVNDDAAMSHVEVA